MGAPTIISATEASHSFSEVLNQVCYKGQIYEVKRGKEIIARIVPVSQKNKEYSITKLNEFFKKLPSLDDNDIDDFEKTIETMRNTKGDKVESWD